MNHVHVKVFLLGAGPVGLSAALFLSFQGLNPRVIERLPEREVQSRAILINPRSMELFDKYGMARKLTQNSYKLKAANLHKNNTRLVRFDFDRDKIEHKFPVLTVQDQAESERQLVNILNSRNILVERGYDLIGIKNIEQRIEVKIQKPNGGDVETSQYDYVFSADGAHSVTRKCLEIGFPGITYDGLPWSLYDLKLETKLAPNELNMFLKSDGFLFIVRVKDDIWRVFSKFRFFLT